MIINMFTIKVHHHSVIHNAMDNIKHEKSKSWDVLEAVWGPSEAVYCGHCGAHGCRVKLIPDLGLLMDGAPPKFLLVLTVLTMIFLMEQLGDHGGVQETLLLDSPDISRSMGRKVFECSTADMS